MSQNRFGTYILIFTLKNQKEIFCRNPSTKWLLYTASNYNLSGQDKGLSWDGILPTTYTIKWALKALLRCTKNRRTKLYGFYFDNETYSTWKILFALSTNLSSRFCFRSIKYWLSYVARSYSSSKRPCKVYLTRWSCHIHLVADTILLASNYQLKVKVKENRINYNRCILCCQTCLKPIIIFQNPLAVLAYFALSPNMLNPWSCQWIFAVLMTP